MRILLVDDDAHLASALCRGLRAEGFAVDHAADGPDGLWLALENPYDAIVLDVMLPGLDGHEVCRRMRAEGRWAPVLMLTARDRTDDEVDGLDSGADDFLRKPFSYDVLRARLRALFRRGQRERPAVLRVGDLELDPATRRVGRAGTPISLSPRQFALLEYLMRRAGEPVSKADILDHVWDFGFDGSPNIVEVYIGQLRRRVDAPFARASITTVRQVGYRLDADVG